ncbi:MAG: transketolase, partial [Nitrosopumilus sp. BACL13 MAG-120910-bin56]
MNDPIMADMRSEYSKSLIQLGHDNPNVVVLGADTTDSLNISGFGKQFPDRFFNVGIAEANLVTISAGLAASGKISFASTYAIFLPGRAVDQIRNNIAYPSPSGKKGLNVKLVSSHGGLSVGPDGGSHQQIEDIAIMRVIPNFRVFIPADTVSVSKLTQLMASEYGPFYMRMARSKVPIVHSESQEFKIGKGITVKDGSDCTIAACGITVRMALEAAEML